MYRPALLAAVVLMAVLVGPSRAPLAGAGPSCDRAKVRGVVAAFVSAYNRGDLDELNALFARSGRFQEYRVLPFERNVPDSADRRSLIAYFEERHRQGDVFKLNDLDVGRAEGGGFWFQAHLERESNDIRPWASGDYVPQKSGVNPDCTIRLFRIEWNGP